MAALSYARTRFYILLILLSFCTAHLISAKKSSENITLSSCDAQAKPNTVKKEKKEKKASQKEKKPSRKEKRRARKQKNRKNDAADLNVETAQQNAPEEKPSVFWSWFTQRKTLTTMNYEELKEAKNRYLATNDPIGALKFMEKMVTMCTDLDELRSLMLEVADLLYETRTLQPGNLEKAGKMYKEFMTLYPGSSKLEHASYKAILCSFDRIKDAERDQTKTEETLELAERFLERTDVFDTYVTEVVKIADTCRERLLESEFSIYNFYISRRRYLSASQRITNIRKQYLPSVPGAEPQLLSFECELAKLLNNTELFTQKQTELAQKFPDFNASVIVAQNAKSKTSSFANRF